MKNTFRDGRAAQDALQEAERHRIQVTINISNPQFMNESFYDAINSNPNDAIAALQRIAQESANAHAASIYRLETQANIREIAHPD